MSLEPSVPGSRPLAMEGMRIALNSWGWQFFCAFLDNSNMEATDQQLLEYAVKELKVDLEKLPPSFKENLPVMIVYFMNLWSGWQFKTEFESGKFSREHYYTRFHRFMTHKMNVTVRTQFEQALKLVGDKETEDDRQVNTEITTDEGALNFSPYCITIKCPPHMLNTLVFSNVDDDVTMKQHLGAVWRELSVLQVLNWPNIEVSFQSTDLCFVRRQASEYLRYLNFLAHDCRNVNDKIVESVEVLSGDARKRDCYSLDFMDTYCGEYLDAIKLVCGCESQQFNEIRAIISQFLRDLHVININNSIATNTKILFRLSKVPYIRNKKLIKGSSSNDVKERRVGYCEIIAPKIELTVHYIKPEQLQLKKLSFKHIEFIKTFGGLNFNDVMPRIVYRCTFCDVTFQPPESRRLLVDHLRTEHRMEQNVRCTVCKKQYDVLALALARWYHACNQERELNDPSPVLNYGAI